MYLYVENVENRTFKGAVVLEHKKFVYNDKFLCRKIYKRFFLHPKNFRMSRILRPIACFVLEHAPKCLCFLSKSILDIRKIADQTPFFRME